MDGRVNNDNFSVTHPFLDGSFSSSNSTEILMRQFYVQKFSLISCSCEEISNKRTDGRTHWPILVVYSLFEYTKTCQKWRLKTHVFSISKLFTSTLLVTPKFVFLSVCRAFEAVSTGIEIKISNSYQHPENGPHWRPSSWTPKLASAIAQRMSHSFSMEWTNSSSQQ